MQRKATSGDALGDRMKDYEGRETARRFLPGVPVCARIDGRSFSQFTRRLERPFDARMSAAMVQAARDLVEGTQALIGYTQSDEISLLWLAPDMRSDIFFSGRVQKMCSNLASKATMAFALALQDVGLGDMLRLRPEFDCRVWQVPNRTEAANTFLWRNQDATKNSISMAARHHYPHRELQGKSGPQMQEMLFAAGVNFNSYPPGFKRGTWVRRITTERPYTAAERARIAPHRQPSDGAVVSRSEVVAFDLPKFGSIMNREAVLFEAADPVLITPALAERAGATVGDCGADPVVLD